VGRARPFLRWVGGKARVASFLAGYVPPLGDQSRYFEPFLGAGSLFFAVRPSQAVLSDANASLIDCFTRVKAEPGAVWECLRELTYQTDPTKYYELRATFNDLSDSVEKAALFIYLNKTCFNGIWRVNRRGQFNVPYGGKVRAGFPTIDQLKECSAALRCADLRVQDFSEALTEAKAGDFVYMDPPYLPISSTSFFRHYTSERFAIEAHERVAELCHNLSCRGVKVMITEADSLVARGWYRGYHVAERAVRRYVASNGDRYEAAELLIANYPLDRRTRRLHQ
jgi:DNA adenine methylase